MIVLLYSYLINSKIIHLNMFVLNMYSNSSVCDKNYNIVIKMQWRQIDLIILIFVSILTLSYTTVYYQVASVTVPNSEKTSYFSIRCQMISEERLVRLLDMSPFSIPKLRQRHNLSVCVKTAVVVWQITAVYSLIALLLEMTVSDVETFVWKLSCTVILVFTRISINLMPWPSVQFWKHFWTELFIRSNENYTECWWWYFCYSFLLSRSSVSFHVLEHPEWNSFLN